MEILTRNNKKIVKIGGESLGVFLTTEVNKLNWKVGNKVDVVAFQKGKEKGIIIKKV